jgi:hypothetical protein
MPFHISAPLLKIPSERGSPVNEYRIRRGRIEFRSLDSGGQPFAYTGGSWRALDTRDLELHFALNTPVAQWLIDRLAKASAARQKSWTTPLDST